MGIRMNLFNVLQFDGDFFEGIDIPPAIDRDILKVEIFRRCGMSMPIWTDVHQFKILMSFWFKAHKWEFAEMEKTMHYDYNPIENYDRKEDSTRTFDSTKNSDYANISHIDTSNENKTENKVSAFNTSAYQNKEKNDSNGKANSDANDSGNSNDKEHNVDGYTARMHGNIGVTTTQAMIQEQRNVVDFSIYEYIAKKFDNTFFLGVY